MSNDQKNTLFTLIKSLTKSEKRQFKLFVGRLGGNSNSKFVGLFNALDKMQVYNEEEAVKVSGTKKAQLPNLKANLYRQILVSLRLNPKQQTTRIQIREQLDFATILYNKGLYTQSLKILEKAKNTALLAEENTIAFEIVEFEKNIETQYITRSLYSRADDLSTITEVLSTKNNIASKLSNLSIQLYGFLLKNGYAKNQEDYLKTRTYFYYHMPQFELNELGFREKLHLYMAQLWYCFIIQDFIGSYKNATKWVTLFKLQPAMRNLNPVFYLKGHNYLLESLYYLRYRSKFESTLKALKSELNSPDFQHNSNTRVLSFLYSAYNDINLHFLNGAFETGITEIPVIEEQIETFNDKIDAHHILVFYYKFACLHFGADEFEKCIYYLNKIIGNKELGMREDLLCYTRILHLISHYELGKDQHIEQLIKSTFKFLLKMDDMHQVQAEIILFLRGLKSIYPHELKGAFVQLHEVLKKLEHHPFEKRSFLYLDILSWLEGKIQGKTTQQVVLSKTKLMK